MLLLLGSSLVFPLRFFALWLRHLHCQLPWTQPVQLDCFCWFAKASNPLREIERERGQHHSGHVDKNTRVFQSLMTILLMRRLSWILLPDILIISHGKELGGKEKDTEWRQGKKETRTARSREEKLQRSRRGNGEEAQGSRCCAEVQSKITSEVMLQSSSVRPPGVHKRLLQRLIRHFKQCRRHCMQYGHSHL